MGEERYVRYSIVPREVPSPITDRTDQADATRRKGERNLGPVDALVLHQTGFSRGNGIASYDRVPAHFVILPNGRIIRLHQNWYLLHASNGFNSRSVAVEFVGNFPNERDRWWRPGRFGRHKLTPAQARGGRTLVTYLRRTLRITHIFAHRQSNRRHSNCCGPQVWYNVGQWAVGRGLNDGGSGYAISGGLPIPDAWRDASHDVFSR